MSEGVLNDVLARVLRARDALVDGEHEFAEQILDDLAHELWREVERVEREAVA